MKTTDVAVASLAAIVALFMPVREVLIWNGSHSVPIGFYLRSYQTIRVGALVTVRAGAAAPSYARLRHFDGRRDRFIKRVAALSGAFVCADDAVVHIADRHLERRDRDSVGRALPHWRGCRALSANEAFLVGDSDDSFDSRYFGPVRLDQIDGVWRPIQMHPQTRER